MAMKLEPWEHSILGVYNISPRPFEGPSRHWFDFLANAGALEGDFLEFGVYRGRSLVATAMLLQERGSDAIAVGFDTFEGFPSYSPFDSPERFEQLLEEGRISDDHFDRVLKNRAHLEWLGRGSDPSSSSSSGDFSGTSQEFVQGLVDYTGTTSQVEIFAGDFAASLSHPANAERKVAGALIDCDLWDGYRVSLDYVWPRLSDGGMVFLDEYYSLKFPGPRFAVDSFCEVHGITPTLLDDEGSWERWALFK